MNKKGYDDCAELTYEMVGRWMFLVKERPLFAMPPREIAFIASIADVGLQLARNEAAREMVRLLIGECDRRKFSDYPTVMMLRASLEECDLPIMWTSLAELGLQVSKGEN